MKDETAQTKYAATVILINQDCEFLLMERSAESMFLPGMIVFPGGGLDQADKDNSLLDFAPGFSPDGIKPALYFTAIRELFEEASVLLARFEDGGIPDLTDSPFRCRFLEYRDLIHDNKMSLPELAVKEHLIYTPDSLIPFSRWITPRAMKTRYDTQFFIAVIPDRQEVAADGNELVNYAWIKAGHAIDMNAEAKIKLLPPTLFILNELVTFTNIDEIIRYAQNKDKPVIMPEAYSENGLTGVRFPFDTDYSDAEYKLPPAPGIPSRALLTDKGWRLV